MAPWVIPAAIGGLNALTGFFGAEHQAAKNMELAKYQANANKQLLQEQLAYNSPASQMARYKQAGLNPHLAVSGGNPGNQAAPLTHPDIKPADHQAAFQALGPMINQTAMTASQVQAIDANTRQTTVVTDLKRLETRVMERNPLLNDAGYKAMIDGLRSTAEIKAAESRTSAMAAGVAEATAGQQVEKAWREVDVLEQRFKLNELDAKVKSQIILSKEFQNAILEVQKRFAADGQIGPNQIYEFIKLLLQKSL